MAKLERYLILSLLCLASLTGWAQEDDAAYVHLNFRVYVRGNADWEGLYYYAQPGKPEELSLSRGVRSGLYAYQGEPVITFYRKVADEQGIVQYVPAGSAPVDPGSHNVLVLATPARGGSQELNLAIMPEMKRSIPPDNMVFLNGTGAVLIGVVGDEKVVLQPGLSTPIPTNAKAGQNDLQIGLTVKYQDSYKVVLHNSVRFYPNQRYLIVLMPPEKEGSFDIVAFRLVDQVI